MGNSCGKSASVEFVGTPASERGGGGKDPRLTDDDNNNIQPVDVSQSQLRATAEESNNNVSSVSNILYNWCIFQFVV